MFKVLVIVSTLFMTACSTVMAGYTPAYKPKEAKESIVLCATKDAGLHILILMNDRDTVVAALEHPNFPCAPTAAPVILEEFLGSTVDFKQNRVELWMVSNPTNATQTGFALIVVGGES